MPETGYDHFAFPSGTRDVVHCGVCGSACTVTRDLYGPTSYAAAMARKGRVHDSFTCPHHAEPWHEQALELVQAIEDMPSRRVADLMRLDLEELLAEHGLTLPIE